MHFSKLTILHLVLQTYGLHLDLQIYHYYFFDNFNFCISKCNYLNVAVTFPNTLILIFTLEIPCIFNF